MTTPIKKNLTPFDDDDGTTIITTKPIPGRVWLTVARQGELRPLGGHPSIKQESTRITTTTVIPTAMSRQSTATAHIGSGTASLMKAISHGAPHPPPLGNATALTCDRTSPIAVAEATPLT